jgi:hypothetical protein
MAYDVATDHQIIDLKKNRMQLLDRGSGKMIVDAKRDKDTLVWTVSADGVPDVTAPTVNGSPTPRSEAITAMVNQALASLMITTPAKTGYSTLVPHGLVESP